MNEKNNNTEQNGTLRFWTGPLPLVLAAVLAGLTVWVGRAGPELLGRGAATVMSVLGAAATVMVLTIASRVRKAVKQAAEKKAADAAAPAPQPAAQAAPEAKEEPVAAVADEDEAGDDEDDDEDDEDEYEFPFLRLMDTRSRLYLCFETRSWYAIQFQMVATPSAHGDTMGPSWYPADVDHDYATKQDIWIAKTDLTDYELDPFPVPNLPWKNSGSITLRTASAKYSFALLGDVDEEDLADFFRR